MTALASALVATPASPIPCALESGAIFKNGTAVVIEFNPPVNWLVEIAPAKLGFAFKRPSKPNAGRRICLLNFMIMV